MVKRALENAQLEVVVLCGGAGSEAEVSLNSGAAVADALAEMEIPCRRIALKEHRLPGDLNPDRDLILPVLHGHYGEDGQLAAELEAAGFTFGGCRMAAHSLCYDKLATRGIASELGIPVAQSVYLAAGSEHRFSDLQAALDAPFIIKPRFDGSSVGLERIGSEVAFAESAGHRQHRDFIAEKLISGRDLTVGLFRGKALGVAAIEPEGGFYDYSHKYTAGKASIISPADIPEASALELGRLSERLFAACHCRDLARVDFRGENEGPFTLLEINTLPGMTGTSLWPRTAAVSGWTFKQLLEAWVSTLLQRHEKGPNDGP
jgi:D-alanine-D-alanine ligase